MALQGRRKLSLQKRSQRKQQQQQQKSSSSKTCCGCWTAGDCSLGISVPLLVLFVHISMSYIRQQTGGGFLSISSPSSSSSSSSIIISSSSSSNNLKDDNNVVEKVVAASDATAIIDNAILNNPTIDSTKGTLQQATTDLTAFTQLQPFNLRTDKWTRGWDNEAYDAVTQYFWGQQNGIILELGALDGKMFSVSGDFLPFKWHRLLMEASPKWASTAKTQAPDATYVHAAICQKDSATSTHNRVVHYLSDDPNHDGSINGIGEFMSPAFMSRFHRAVYDASDGGRNFAKVTNWTLWTQQQKAAKGFLGQVDEIPCLDLATIFQHLGLSKINFFVLDVEGGELSVLQSIDWSTIQFDVLAVETEPFDTKNRPEGYAQKVRDYLQQQGYQFEHNQGRNSWFKHPNYSPSKKPL